MPSISDEEVTKKKSSDVAVTCEAETEENVAGKEYCQSVMSVDASPSIAKDSSQEKPSINNDEILKPGESIAKGFCPQCGDVAVKTTGCGYHPGCGSIIFHLFMCTVSVGGWIPIWIGWALGCHFRKGKKNCMQCGKLLQLE